MDMKYVTPFVLIFAAFCFQALGIAPVLAAPNASVPVLEIPAAFTRI
jgi:hypothetical protein